MSLALRRSVDSDLAVLAEMNKQLIVDEGSPNPMSIRELEERMRGWFCSDWCIDLICDKAQVVGYALYQFRKNPYFTDEEEVYLRQYFVKPEFRNRGYGREGIKLLCESRFRPGQTVIIDVMECNPDGMRFWKKAGFAPYCTTMKLNS